MRGFDVGLPSYSLQRRLGRRNRSHFGYRVDQCFSLADPYAVAGRFFFQQGFCMTPQPRLMAKDIKAQKLPFPAKQSDMTQQPETNLASFRASGKLEGKAALITGGDSGIGRAVAIAFAMEGAMVAVVYNTNEDDANETKRMVSSKGGQCLPIRADVRYSEQCRAAVKHTVDTLVRLDILVNNAAYQMAVEKFDDVTEDDIRRTFETNIFGYMFMAQAALPHLKSGASIINTGSIVGLVGNSLLVRFQGRYSCLYQGTGAKFGRT